jgi:hypothetical protein
MKTKCKNYAGRRQLVVSFGKGSLGAVVIAALLLGAPTSRADNDPYAAAHPPPGIQPQRPANYEPYKYPDTP